MSVFNFSAQPSSGFSGSSFQGLSAKGMTAERFVLLNRPVGLPVEAIFSLEKFPIVKNLKENELRLHGLYYSVDPYMRGRMNAGKSYVPPFELNEPIVGNVVARVAESNAQGFKTGDLVVGQLPWATEAVVSSDKVQMIDTKIAMANEYLGVLGMTGLAAYFGLLRIGKPKAGETVVISGAAGAVGSVAGQIAKIMGCKVLGITGTDEKARFLKGHLGFSEALNYNTPGDLQKSIQAACPNGVDIYFDNVGGPISDAVLQNMNQNGRVVICGQISLYNSKDAPSGPRLQPTILTRRLLVQGFIVGDFKAEFPMAIAELTQWLNDGKIESSETVVKGFNLLPKAFIGLFSGVNNGKMIVKAEDWL
jgi:NADPH-dependent curcumin reductase CurA